MSLKLLRQFIKEEIGRNYHTIDPSPNTWEDFQDFEVDIFPNADGSYLGQVSFKGKKITPLSKFMSYGDAVSRLRNVVDQVRVEYMNSEQEVR
jgi:hypothetical protein